MAGPKSMRELITEHPFFGDLAPEYLELIAGCGSNVKFDAERYIFREGDEANEFYLIRRGKVALEIHAPERGPIIIQTLHDGDILGWSWLVPPHKKRFAARAVEPTRAIALDGACLRKKCDEDPRLGYELLQRFAQIIGERLQATRLQILDLYGEGRPPDREG